MGIDIGSSSVKVVIGEYDGQTISFGGSGIASTKGVKKGKITNLEEVVRGVKEAYTKAKRVAGISPELTFVAISGMYGKSIYSRGIVNLPEREIHLREINRAIKNAVYNARIPQDSQILHAIPYQFQVDNMEGIYDPIGMGGNRLEVDVHIVLIEKSALENVKRIFKQAGIPVAGIVLSPFASGLGVLTQEEREQGSAILDVGYTTTNIGIFYNKNLVAFDKFGVGSHHITKDIAEVAQIPIKEAEKIKKNFNALLKHTKISVKSNTIPPEPQEVSVRTIATALVMRMKEMFLIYRKLLAKTPFRKYISTIAITGGFAKFPSIDKIAKLFFPKQVVRVGIARQIQNFSSSGGESELSVAVGAMVYGVGREILYELDHDNRFRGKHNPLSGIGPEEDVPLPPKREEKRRERVKQPQTTSTQSTERKKEILDFRDLSRRQGRQEDGVWKKFLNMLNNLF
jgi:cell division protein FtsA